MWKLTWRDAVATLFAIVAGAITLAVTQGWDWPLLGSYRAGTAALLIVGVPMCAIGGFEFSHSPEVRHISLLVRDPFLVIAVPLGIAAAVVAIWGLVSPSETMFIALAVLMGVLWVIATVRHAFEGGSRSLMRGTPALAA